MQAVAGPISALLSTTLSRAIGWTGIWFMTASLSFLGMCIFICHVHVYSMCDKTSYIAIGSISAVKSLNMESGWALTLQY